MAGRRVTTVRTDQSAVSPVAWSAIRQPSRLITSVRNLWVDAAGRGWRERCSAANGWL